MSEPMRSETPPEFTPDTCARCSKTLTAADRIDAGDRSFCRSCYAALRNELGQTIAGMSTDINYGNAALGAVLGGAVGALLWWGFTAVTHIALGLVAVAIGFLVGEGAVRFAGNKRSGGLQILSIGVALASYLCATYLVNMTFINKALADKGESFRVGLMPQNFDLFTKVVTADFGLMDWVFLAIVVYEAWKIPKPLALPPDAAA